MKGKGGDYWANLRPNSGEKVAWWFTFEAKTQFRKRAKWFMRGFRKREKGALKRPSW